MDVTPSEKQRISSTILAKYAETARTPRGRFRYPTGREGLDRQGYDPALLDRIPGEVQEYFVGVGNPLSLGRLEPGQRVLDIGCGAGVDALLAALLVGPGGEVVGVEFSPAMAARAEENRRLSGVGNVSFLEGSAESLPVADESFDVVISSGVFNLVVDKKTALAEAWRALKPGGRLQVADQTLVGQPAPDRETMVASWFT